MSPKYERRYAAIERRERERTNKCEHCGSILSAVTWTCVRGAFCPGARVMNTRTLNRAAAIAAWNMRTTAREGKT